MRTVKASDRIGLPENLGKKAKQFLANKYLSKISSEPCPPEFIKVVNDNFWDLI